MCQCEQENWENSHGRVSEVYQFDFKKYFTYQSKQMEGNFSLLSSHRGVLKMLFGPK